YYSDEESDMGDVSGLLPAIHLSADGDEYLLSDSPDPNHLFFPNEKETVESCYRDFLPASQLVLAALREIGEAWCCLVGGMAIRLNGKRAREVKDLDIIILNASADSRSIQVALVQRYPTMFFLVPPRDRAATFMKLFFRIPKTPHSIKVDLLLSSIPILEIPSTFHKGHFVSLHSFQVAPIYFVLYHKLFGWNLRYHAQEKWNNEKAKEVDHPDIIYLCDRIGQSSFVTFTAGLRGECLSASGFQSSATTVGWQADSIHSPILPRADCEMDTEARGTTGATYADYLLAASVVIGALEEFGEACCLVGGMAVRLFGKQGRVVKVSTHQYLSQLVLFETRGSTYGSLLSDTGNLSFHQDRFTTPLRIQPRDTQFPVSQPLCISQHAQHSPNILCAIPQTLWIHASGITPLEECYLEWPCLWNLAKLASEFCDVYGPEAAQRFREAVIYDLEIGVHKTMSGPTYAICLLAARQVMSALRDLGQPSCFVGGMGVRLNGKKDRVVKRQQDLDILVLNRKMNASDLQDALVEWNPKRFYL
ncbi:16154_t:CDS:2, partial [Acaulospora colombiana]